MDNFAAVSKEYNDECLVKLRQINQNTGFLFKLLGRPVDE